MAYKRIQVQRKRHKHILNRQLYQNAISILGNDMTYKPQLISTNKNALLQYRRLHQLDAHLCNSNRTHTCRTSQSLHNPNQYKFHDLKLIDVTLTIDTRSIAQKI